MMVRKGDNCSVEHDSSSVEPGSRSREHWFKDHCCYFEAWTIFLSQYCLSTLRCVHEYLAIDSNWWKYINTFHAIIATWLNASQRSRVGGGVNMSARG